MVKTDAPNGPTPSLGERAFVVTCAAVFLLIAGCAAYFVLQRFL